MQYIFKLHFKKKKIISLLSNNIRALESNGEKNTHTKKHKTIGTKPVCYFLKEQVILMKKIA